MRCISPLLCLCLIVGSHAACALSGPFSWQCEKGKENHRDTIFLKKNYFFSILISEFQDNINDLDFLIIKEDVPFYGIDRMRELDNLIDRNMAADMLVYRPNEFEERIKLGDPFIETINKEGRVLYG